MTVLRVVSFLLGISFLLLQVVTVSRLWRIDHGVQELKLIQNHPPQQNPPRDSHSETPPQGNLHKKNAPPKSQTKPTNESKERVKLGQQQPLSLPPAMNQQLKWALEEKKQLEEISALEKNHTVLVISPIGQTSQNKNKNSNNNKQRRPGYKEGHDDTFTLECSLQIHHYPHGLMAATFDDRQGFDSLDIRKIQTIYETLEQLISTTNDKDDQEKRYANTTLVAVVDAFDVVVQKEPHELIQDYIKQPFPIVVGGEPTCWEPDSDNTQSNVSTRFCTLPHLQKLHNPRLYLNSGVMVATLGTLTRFLQYALHHLPGTKEGLAPWPGTLDKFNDQAYWGYWYTQYHPLIGLAEDPADPNDVNAEIGELSLIANIGKERNRKRAFKQGKFHVGHRTPAIVHFPGATAKDFKVYAKGKEYYRDLCSLDSDKAEEDNKAKSDK